MVERQIDDTKKQKTSEKISTGAIDLSSTDMSAVPAMSSASSLHRTDCESMPQEVPVDDNDDRAEDHKPAAIQKSNVLDTIPTNGTNNFGGAVDNQDRNDDCNNNDNDNGKGNNQNQNDPMDSDSDRDSDDDKDGDGDGDQDHDDSESDHLSDDNSKDSRSSDDQSESNGNQEGLSEYERLREERIRRNQQYLATLGLEQTLPKKQPVKKRKRSMTEIPEVHRRSSLGRASKQKPISYNVDEATNIRNLIQSNTDKQQQQQSKEVKPKLPSSSSKRPKVPLVVYKEFKRIARDRKEMIRQLQKYNRAAIRHLEYWKRRSQKYRARLQESTYRQQLRALQAEERRQLGGKTKLECLQELEKRITELSDTLAEFDNKEAARKTQEEQQRIEQEMRQKQIELERKLELVDALDRFPVAYQETTATLYNQLLKRAPKDPPPPRRSTRVSIEEPKSKPTTPDKEKLPEEADVQQESLTLQRIRAALVLHKKKHTIQDDSSARNISEQSAIEESEKCNQPTNSAGWISPPFAASLDRSWLSREMPSEDIASTPPQIGQLVFYYPGAHKTFLRLHPDIWGNQKGIRTPLWEQAVRDRNIIWEQEKRLTKNHDIQQMADINAPQSTRTFDSTEQHTKNPDSSIQQASSICDTSQPVTTTQENTFSNNECVKMKHDESRLQLDARSTSRRRQRNSRKHKSTMSKDSHLTSGRTESLTTVQEEISSPKLTASGSYSRTRKRGAAIPASQSYNTSPEHTSPTGGPGSVFGIDSKPWWTDEWIDQIDLDLGRYPILCRVEWTNAEFPYDPNLQYRKVDKDGNVTWTIKEQKPTSFKKKHEKTVISLQVLLQPLTPVLPPEWNDSSLMPKNEHALSLPPKFSVLTFPSKDAAPFLIPFSWAFTKCHLLSIGDSVTSPWSDDSKTEGLSGKVSEFLTIGSRFGSFRLDDKVPQIRYFVDKFSVGDPMEIEEALTIPGYSSLTQELLPAEDAALLVDFLNIFVTKQEVGNVTDPQPRNYFFLDLIRSAFPLYNGVGFRREVFHRKVTYVPGWMLQWVKKSKNGFAASSSLLLANRLRQGVPNRLENALRIKLRFALQDFVDHRPEASTFMDLVTEDVAPSYYCAIPVGMHFERILARLDTGNKGDDCYYTSFDSVLADTQTVLENCLIYNNPDSPLVTVSSFLIPALKMQLKSIFMKHENEREANYLAEMERKNFEHFESTETELHDFSVEAEGLDTSYLTSLNTPYRGNLDRSKLQSLMPDTCWNTTTTQYTDPMGDEVWWNPQIGDHVLYSQKLHSEFVRNKQAYLSPCQCIIPAIQPITAPSPIKEPNFVASRWLQARIMSVQATFPREIARSTDKTSPIPSPILAIGLHFLYEWADSLVTIFWEQGTSSFLRPTWINDPSIGDYIETVGVALESTKDCAVSDRPQGISSDSIRRISRCFDVLKHRCLNGIAPDHVDPKLNLENVNQSGSLTVPRTGTRNLPSFDELLSPETNNLEEKGINTRGIRRTLDDDAIGRLSDALYLPPWTIETIEDDEKKKRTLSYESMMPLPNLSLELVRLRLKRGYYRQVAAIVGDLQEAYISCALFILSAFASKRKKRISIRKILSGLQHKLTKESGESHEGLPDDEISLIARLENARKLYSMAILVVNDTWHLEKILGLNVKRASRIEPHHTLDRTIDDSVEKSEMKVAAERIRYLLAAAGRELCSNLFDDLGLMKIKVVVEGEVIKAKHEYAPTTQSVIILGHNQYTSNDALAQALLRRPGRRAPCIRCQVFGASFYTCRVLRCHSNPDFDFLANWSELGGIDGLLAPFQPSKASKGDSTQKERRDNDPILMDEDNILEDPKDDLEKACQAVKISTFLTQQAEALASEEIKLSTTFIKTTFPVDPDDGHYIWCTVCGLSGDVLCCDGCSTVVHANCIGLQAIPEDDWFCEACLIHRKLPNEASKQIADQTRPACTSDAATLQNALDDNDVNPASETGKQTPVINDEEFAAQLKSLVNLVDELDRKRYPLGKPLKYSQISIGTVLYKTFARYGRFKGTVVSTPTELHPYCKVEYEDGDFEELEPAEVLNLLKDQEKTEEESKTTPTRDSSTGAVDPNTIRNRRSLDSVVTVAPTNSVAGPRKRGRPRKNPIQTVGGDGTENSSKSATPGNSKQGGLSPLVIAPDHFSSQDNTKQVVLEVKRKRGRPRKLLREDENKTGANFAPRGKRGRASVSHKEGTPPATISDITQGGKKRTGPRSVGQKQRRRRA